MPVSWTRRGGLTAGSGARTGIVTLIQRFGSALNLNVHLHMLILDGVYTLEQITIDLYHLDKHSPLRQLLP